MRLTRAVAPPPTLITHERFRDRAAMQAHNDGAGSKAFFAATTGLIGDVIVLIGDEVSSYKGALS